MHATNHGKVVLTDPDGWHSVVHSLPRPDALQLLENKLIGETLPVATTRVYTVCEYCFMLRQLFTEHSPLILRFFNGTDINVCLFVVSQFSGFVNTAWLYICKSFVQHIRAPHTTTHRSTSTFVNCHFASI